LEGIEKEKFEDGSWKHEEEVFRGKSEEVNWGICNRQNTIGKSCILIEWEKSYSNNLKRNK